MRSVEGISTVHGGEEVKLEEIDRCAAGGVDFAFETTLAGKAYVHRISSSWQSLGAASCPPSVAKRSLTLAGFARQSAS
jgi:hypothetical protein